MRSRGVTFPQYESQRWSQRWLMTDDFVVFLAIFLPV